MSGDLVRGHILQRPVHARIEKLRPDQAVLLLQAESDKLVVVLVRQRDYLRVGNRAPTVQACLIQGIGPEVS